LILFNFDVELLGNFIDDLEIPIFCFGDFIVIGELIDFLITGFFVSISFFFGVITFDVFNFFVVSFFVDDFVFEVDFGVDFGVVFGVVFFFFELLFRESL